MPYNHAPSRCLALLLACLAALRAFAQEEIPFTQLFDTRVASTEPLADEAVVKRTGWQLVAEDNIDYRFVGDAVLLNDKLAVVVRKQGHGAEAYSTTAKGFARRAAIGHAGQRSSMHDSINALKIIENNSSAVMLEVVFKGAGSAATGERNGEAAALRFRLTTGEAILEIRAGEGATAIGVESKTRYVVVPDFFGDDMVFGAELFGGRGGGRGLPAENFCLHLIDGGDAIMMNVWQSSEQEVWLEEAQRQAPDAEKNSCCACRIGCLKDKSIWLAFLESPGIWRAASAGAMDDWKPPFPAKWRRSYVRENGVADSWDMEQGPAPEQTTGTRMGPLITYPIDREGATPLTVVCPTDVMRNTLAVGPCQYILAVEGLAAQGDPTPNNVMNWVGKQFEQKKEMKASGEIKERLGQMAAHVAAAKARTERYGEFASQARDLLAGKAGAEPYASIIDDLDRFVKAGLTLGASPERARQLAGEILALIGQRGADQEKAFASCQRLGGQLRSIGAIQDGALARARMAVRRLKQEGLTVAANQPQDAGLAQKVQRLAEQMLQEKPATYQQSGGPK